jgi:hypothetical protein
MAYSLADIRERLFVSVISDCLDQLGFRNQALPSRIRPLDDKSVLVGRARTPAAPRRDGGLEAAPAPSGLA